MGDTLTRYANTPGQVLTATFQATPITTNPVPAVAYYSDATYTTLVSGPSNMTLVSANVWTAPVPNLAAQTLYIDYQYKTEVGGTLLHNQNDVLRLVAADVLSSDGLCTLAEAKLQLGKTTAAQDAEIQDYIDAVTAIVEDFCGTVLPRTVTEWHSPGGSVLVLNERVASVTTLTEYAGSTGTDLTADSDFLLDPALGGILTRLSAGSPYDFRNRVKVTYTAGFASVPPAINLAARLLVQYLWRTRNGGAGLPALSDEPSPYDGAEVSRARTLLERYRRLPGIA